MMRFRNGSHSRTPVSVWAIMIVLGWMLLPSPTRLVALQEAVTLASASDDPNLESQKELNVQVGEVAIRSDEFESLPLEWMLAESAKHNEVATPDLKWEEEPFRTSIVSASNVKKNLPVLYTILSAEQTKAMREKLKFSSIAEMVYAPEMTRLEGKQSAIRVMSPMPYPYAMGNKRVGVVDVGSKIDLRATLVGSDSVKLQCDMSNSELRSLEKVEVQLSGKEKSTIEIPELSTATFQCALRMLLGRTVLLARLDGKTKTCKLNLISCSLNTEPRFPVMDAKLKALVPTTVVEVAPPFGDRANPVSVHGALEKHTDQWSIEPPSDDVILRAFIKSRPETHVVADIQQERISIRIEKEKIHEVVEPVRFVQLVGNASLRHALYRCKITIVSTKLLTSNLDEEEETHEFFVDQAKHRLAE